MSRGDGPVFEEQCLLENQELTDENVKLRAVLRSLGARAERAEAAAGQIRAALEVAKATLVAARIPYDQVPTHYTQEAIASVTAALATDAGRDWVSPEAHAAVVAERDRVKRELDEGYARGWHSDHLEERDALRARAEKAEAERDEAREQALEEASAHLKRQALFAREHDFLADGVDLDRYADEIRAMKAGKP